MKLKTRILVIIFGGIMIIILYKLFAGKENGFLGNNVQLGEAVIDYNNENLEKLPDELTERKLKIDSLVEKYTFNIDEDLSASPWDIAADWVNSRQVHPSDVPELGAILKAMATYPIVKADVGHKGTQLKMSLILKGGQRVAFKPKWYDRDTVMSGSPYEGKDRHNGEIASFHLNRILEFRRTPLVVGRHINLQTEILPVATETLSQTFFEQDGNTCFYGKCLYCRGPQDGVCADNTVLEGIIILWLPLNFKLQLFRHPWGRTYKKNKLARWETEANYCLSVMEMPLYDSGPRLADIIDATVLDYLVGNADRHHYEVFKNEPDSMLILLDNGKSFGNPYADERSILAPLYQCCRLRRKTWDRLLYLKDGILSEVLRHILAKENLSPILTEPHYEAIDRRLTHIFKEMDTCFKTHGERHVLIED